MRRALSLFLPTWATDLDARRRRRSKSPPDAAREHTLVAETLVGRQLVRAHCARAAARGVRIGMTIAEARALLPVGAARVIESAPERDEAALRALAHWALRFSPMTAPDPPCGLLMDISGCAHLFGGEKTLGTRVIADVRAMGFNGSVALGPTFGCAWALARFGRRDVSVVPDGRQREALSPLPLAALRIDEDIASAMEEVGVVRIGELIDLPRSSLPARFGPDLLLRLDQALGNAIEVIEPVRSTTPLRSERVFEGPTTHTASIEAAAQEALEDLCALLRRRERGAAALRVELERPAMDPALIDLTLSRPSRAPRHLWSLLQPRLERVHLGFGVEAVTVTATRDARLHQRQHERWRDGARAPDETDADGSGGAGGAGGELIDTLVNRLGDRGVLRAAARETHIPERAFRLRSVMASVIQTPREADAAIVPQDRPSLLLAHPEPAEVALLAPDGPLLTLRWRGQSRRVLTSIGPERIAPEWWRDDAVAAVTRDYFKAQDEDGRWLWLLRDPDSGAWAVHGLWA